MIHLRDPLALEVTPERAGRAVASGEPGSLFAHNTRTELGRNRWRDKIAADIEEEHTTAWLEVGELGAVVRAVQQHKLPIVPSAAMADSMGLSLVVIGPDGPEPLGYRAAELEPTQLGLDACC